jgi:hypothetical protein
MRHSQRKRGATARPNLRSAAPALDPTSATKSRSCDAFGSSWTFLFLLKRDNLSGFPRRISCRVFGSGQKNRPEVTTHADVTSYKSEQKHDRNLLPQSLGRGDVNLGTPAVRTILKANTSHLFSGPVSDRRVIRCVSLGPRFSSLSFLWMSCRLRLAAKVCRNWIGHVPRNGLSVHLLNGVLHSNHIAARGFRGTAGRVLGNFCLVDPEQESCATQKFYPDPIL